MKLFNTLNLMMLALPGALLAKDFRDYQDLAEHGDKELILDWLDANSSADLSNVPVVEMLSMKFVPDATVEKLAGQKMMAKKQALQAGLKAKSAGTPAASPSVSPDSAAEAARVKALEEEVARLKAQLAASQGGAAAGTGSTSPAASTPAAGGLSTKVKLEIAKQQRIQNDLRADIARYMIDSLTNPKVAKYLDNAKKKLTEVETKIAELESGAASVAGDALAGIGGATLNKTGADLNALGNAPSVAVPAQKSAAQIVAEQAQKRAEEMAAKRAAKEAAAAASSGSTSPVSTGSSSGSSSPVSVPSSPVAQPVPAIPVDELTAFEIELKSANANGLLSLIKPLPVDYNMADSMQQKKIQAVLGITIPTTLPKSAKDKVAAWRTQVGQ